MIPGFAKDASPQAVSRNIDKVEKNMSIIVLAPALRGGMVTENEFPNIAQQVSEVYFDGKPFNSSTLKFWHVS